MTRIAKIGAAMALIAGAGGAMAYDSQASRVERLAPCGMQMRSATRCVDVQALARALAARQAGETDASDRSLAFQLATQRDQIIRLQATVASLEGQVALLQMPR